MIPTAKGALSRLRVSAKLLIQSPKWHRQRLSTTNPLRDTKPTTPPPSTSTSTPTTPIQPSSDKHHDLPTFLAYAAATNLPATRTVFVGTHYEYTVAASLSRLGFTLTRTGRASDLGVDLLGHWTLPCFTIPARVLLQCKALAEGPRPRHVRELEGAFVGAPAGWRARGDVLGLLAATREATRGVREALGRSRWPLGFVMVRTDGRVEQLLWNRKAAEMGLEGVGVTIRYLPMEEGGDGGVAREVVLTWKGEVLDAQKAAEDVEEETKSDTAIS